MALSLAVNVYPLESYKIGQKEERPDKDATIAARFARMCVCVCVCACVLYLVSESMHADGVVLRRRELCALWTRGPKSAKVLSTEPCKVNVLAI